MTCQNSNPAACATLSIVVDCLTTFSHGESATVTATIVDENKSPINIDLVSSLEVLLYDIRSLAIARYVYPHQSVYDGETYTSSESYIDPFYYVSVDEYDYDYSNRIWFDYLDITILQVSNNYGSTYVNSYEQYEDEFLNKGKFSFVVSEEITDNLMNGNILIDSKIVYNDKKYVIKCLNIGKLEKNMFS